MNLPTQTVIVFNSHVLLSIQCLIMLKDYIFYVEHVCCFLHTVSYYVKRLCYYVKMLGYLVYEACELVYTTCYYAKGCVVLCT